MTNGTSGPFTSSWPADPESAWEDAARNPGRVERLTDPPEVDSADAASIADWIEDQRWAPLPIFAAVLAAVGAILITGLLIGILPLSGADGTPAVVQWVSGIALMMAGASLWTWEALRRRKRQSEPPREIPQVAMVLCELYPTDFHVHDGDGYREACIAIGVDAPDEQATRVLTAFRIWLERLRADPDAAGRARNEAWQPSSASVFASEEIFGPEAAGGYLVRRPNLPADTWGLLITPRRSAKQIGQLRFADVLRWNTTGWSR